VSSTDLVTVRATIMLDQRQARVLTFSAGSLHNEPIGQASAQAVAATGNALQGDIAFRTMLSKNLLATARYSISDQFGQLGSLGPTLFHIVSVGVVATYGNGTLRPVPAISGRVDGTDGYGLHKGEDSAAPEPVVPASTGSEPSDAHSQ
jgi:hypothetical protein